MKETLGTERLRDSGFRIQKRQGEWAMGRIGDLSEGVQ
jgi:hypothetical protein